MAASAFTVGGALSDHLADTSDAHDASAISFSPGGTVAASDVQAAIAEVASEVGPDIYTLFPGDKPPSSPNALDDEFSDSSFTGWTGRNTPGTVTEGAGYAVMACAAQTGTNVRMYEKTVAGNFDMRAKIFHGTPLINYYESGLYVANNGSGKIIGLEQALSAGAPALQVLKLNSATSFNAVPFAEEVAVPPYLRITSDGTNLKFYYSFDGMAWGLVYTEALATFISSVDRIGFGMNPNHNLASEMSIHWFRKT